MIFRPIPHGVANFAELLSDGSVCYMEPLTGIDQEQFTEEALQNNKQIQLLLQQLARRRDVQKSYGISLVLRTELPLAECARIVGIHRMTLHRWVKEHNAGMKRENDS